jgi:hypothetical protein
LIFIVAGLLREKHFGSLRLAATSGQTQGLGCGPVKEKRKKKVNKEKQSFVA